ncbi:MAG: hypothetical protein QM756_07590 [Polyangiaceae bacterium]
MRRALVGCLGLAALTAAAPAAAQSSETPKDELPRLGLDPAEPSVRSAPPATPFGTSPASSKEYVLDFHGYALLPMRMGFHERENPPPGESGTVLHTPPLIPQNYRRFNYTGVMPEPWIQLNLTYGNSVLAGTVILAASTASEAESFYDPTRQLGISDAYITLNLSEQAGIPLQIRGGAMHNRYGSMGAFDSGRYATPLIARINAIGETATASFKAGPATIVLEQGIGSQLGRMPTGLASSGWNDFGDPNMGASYVGHFHGGLSVANRFQLGLHYATAWTQDDQNPAGTISRGHVNVLGADARLTWGRYGHLYAGVAHTSLSNAGVVSGIIEILNARGGAGIVKEYLGPNSGGNGGLTTFGAQYDLSIARAMFGDAYKGNNPDVLFSLFTIGTKVTSDDTNFDGVLKLKGGGEVTYNMASWFGLSGRVDHVRLDNEFNRRSFTIYTSRLLFHTNWRSRDEFAIQYSHFSYGREVYVERGTPPIDDPSSNPDKDALSLSATFWW